jgi:hypothetical protein
MARSPTREDVPLRRTRLSPALLVSDIENRAMRCLKTTVPLGFSPNEPFAGPQQGAPVIASEGRAASNWPTPHPTCRLIGSAPYKLRAIRFHLADEVPGRPLRDSAPLW